jgi:hypothetical protein
MEFPFLFPIQRRFYAARGYRLTDTPALSMALVSFSVLTLPAAKA